MRRANRFAVKLAMNPFGFSLVEVILVVAILSILVAVAIPNIYMWMPDIRLKSAARDLYSNLQKARMQAIKENRTIQVRFVDPAGGPDTLYFDIDGDSINDSDEYTFNLSNYGSGVGYGNGAALKNWNGDVFTPVPATPVISFSNRGTAGAGTVYVDNENHDDCYAITVVNSGSIKLRKFSGSGWK